MTEQEKIEQEEAKGLALWIEAEAPPGWARKAEELRAEAVRAESAYYQHVNSLPLDLRKHLFGQATGSVSMKPRIYFEAARTGETVQEATRRLNSVWRSNR